MRSLRELRHAAAAGAAAVAITLGGAWLLTAGGTARAQQLYWDVNGTNAGATDSNAANGAWTDPSWTTDPAGLIAPGAFASGSAVVFSAGANATGSSTVTITGNQTTAGFTVEDGTVVLAGTGAVLNGTNPVRINSGATLSISLVTTFSTAVGSVVTLDGGTLRNTGFGSTFWDSDSTLELTSNGGTVDVSTGGVTRFGNSINLQAGTASATLTKTGAGEFRASTGNFTTLDVNQGLYRIDLNTGSETGFGSVNGTVNIASGAAVGTSVDIVSPATRSFTLAAGAAGAAFVTNAPWTINGTVGGAGGFVLNGVGVPSGAVASQTLTLAGANTYGGSTRINLATLAVTGGNAIPDGSAVTLVPTFNLTVALLVNQSETIGSLAGGGTLSGAVNVAAGTLTTGGDNTSTTFAGQITGAGNLVKAGTGTMTLTGAAANTLGGTTTVSAGTLVAAAPGNLSGYNAPGRIFANAGATLAVKAGGASEWAAADIDTLRANATFATGARLGIDTSTASFNYGSSISGALGVAKLGGNTLTLSAANSFTGGTTVSAGTLVAADADALAGGVLDVADGAVAQLQASLPKAVTIATVNAHSTGRLDITDNSLVIRGMSLNDVRQLVGAGFVDGTWMGTGGITSSTAAGMTTTAVGFASNAVLNQSSFKGVSPLNSTDVLVKYTYYGDADLSGTVTLDDFTLFLNGYQNEGSTWLAGDFDYDGVVTLDDFMLFLVGYQQQGSALSEVDSTVATTPMQSADRAIMAAMLQAVPEPASGLLLISLAHLARRRSARSRL